MGVARGVYPLGRCQPGGGGQGTVAALTQGGRSGRPERPWVTIADGRVGVTIPGRALWAPAEVEALLHLCEALAASTPPAEGPASGVGRPEGG